jgi:hypothetical protein
MLLIFFFLFPLLSFAQDWNFVRQKEDIIIWMSPPTKERSRIYKAEMIFDTNVQNVIDLIQDAKRGAKWINRTILFEEIQRKDMYNWHTYSEIEMPFPFENKDLITQNELFEKDSIFFIRLKAMPSFIEEKNGKARIRHFEALWKISNCENNKVKIVYEMQSRAIAGLPNFIIQPIIISSLLDTLLSMKKQLINKNH